MYVSVYSPRSRLIQTLYICTASRCRMQNEFSNQIKSKPCAVILSLHIIPISALNQYCFVVKRRFGSSQIIVNKRPIFCLRLVRDQIIIWSCLDIRSVMSSTLKIGIPNGPLAWSLGLYRTVSLDRPQWNQPCRKRMVFYHARIISYLHCLDVNFQCCLLPNPRPLLDY